jgi:hypothetical protein
MRSLSSLPFLTLLPALALVACNPVSLGRDSGATSSGSTNTSSGSSSSASSSGTGASGTGGSGTGGASGTGAGGSVSSGGSGGSLFAAGMTPDYIVVDDANVYWGDNGTLLGKAKSGGSAWTIAATTPPEGPPSVFDLAVDATGLYYADSLLTPLTSTAIRKAPLLGGAPTVLAQGKTVACFTLAGSALYFVEQAVANTPGGAIYQMPTSGGTPVTVIAEPEATGADLDHAKVTPLGVVTDGSSLYWMNIGPDSDDSTTWGVAGASLSGGAATRVGDTTPRQSGLCKHIVVDDTSVYWVRTRPSPGVVSAPKSGGPETVLAADEAVNLVIDGDYVYYTVTGASSSVRRVAKAGGTPEILADGQKQAFAIAVDASHVYWTDLGSLTGNQYNGDGAVRVIPKP